MCGFERKRVCLCAYALQPKTADSLVWAEVSRQEEGGLETAVVMIGCAERGVMYYPCVAHWVFEAS